MKKNHVLPVAVLAAFPCLVLVTTASTSSRSRADERGLVEETSDVPLLAWADYDADGLADAFALHSGGVGVLYRGLEDGSLALVTEDVGLAELPPLRGAVWEDANSDGLADLLVVLAGGGARLLANDGSSFTDVTAESGLELDGVLAARWSDPDRDGLPDLVTSGPDGYRLHRNLGGGLFQSVTLESPAHAAGAARIGAVLPGEIRARDAAPEALDQALPARERAGASTRGSRRPVLPTDLSLAGGRAQELLAPPSVSGAVGIPFCMAAIEDQSSSSCIGASSVPILGMLHPMSTELNIDADGQVGIGTTSPTSKLDITAQGGEQALEATTSGDVTAAFVSSGGTSEPALEVRSGGYGASVSGRVEQGYRTLFPLGFHPRVVLDSDDGNHGRLTLRDAASQDAVTLRAGGTGTFGSRLDMRNSAGNQTLELGSSNLSNAAFLSMRQASGTSAVTLSAQDFVTPGASLVMNTSTGARTVEILSEEASGNGGQLALGLADGTQTIVLDAQQGSISAELSMRTLTGVETVEIRSEEVAGNGAQMVLRKADGTASIVLDAEQNGDGRIITEVLEITGGADLVESFETGELRCAPGTVVVIDPDRPGELTISTRPYDVRVAGVVSGAGGVRPGLHMGQTGIATGDTPVALTGRVHVLCSGENGAIRPGDLLTSSSTPGHAMRATDPGRSFGTVIGKAMTSLAEGETGLVLVLVNLQ